MLEFKEYLKLSQFRMSAKRLKKRKIGNNETIFLGMSHGTTRVEKTHKN
jgi:hypothetical protein